MHGKLTALSVLFTLLCELQDPSTAFVRAHFEADDGLGSSSDITSCAEYISTSICTSKNDETKCRLESDALSHYSTRPPRFEILQFTPYIAAVVFSLIALDTEPRGQAAFSKYFPKLHTPDFILIYRMSDA